MELVNNNRKNIITGSIRKHPTLSNQYFLGGYIVPLYFILSFENEEIILLEDFNIYRSNYHTDGKITQLVNEPYSYFFIPYTNLPIRITNHSETLADNIFFNKIMPESTAGN